MDVDRRSAVGRAPLRVAIPVQTRLLALVRQIWRGRWLALVVAWCLSLVVAVVISRVQNRYEATARIYIDTQTVLKPLMAGLAFQPDVDQQVRMLARTLVSRPNVERLRVDPDLGWPVTSAESIQREIDGLMNKIKIDPLGTGTNVYLISYRDEDPQRARRLVEALVRTFANLSSADKKEDSENARKFIENEIRSYEAKLAAAEDALKNFKLKNFGFSGVPAQDYFARVSVLADEVNKIRIELSAAEHSRDALRRELADEPPRLPFEALPVAVAAVPSEFDARIEAQRRQLDELLRRFTEAHPDVQNTRRTLTSLESQKRAELEAHERAVANAGTPGAAVAPANPVYQRIRGSLADAEANVALLRGRLGAQQGRLDEVRALANRVPQVEAELSQLNRDYEVIRKNYEQLVARRESAALGEKLDQSTNLAEFRVIDPPRTADRPKFPDRLALAMGGAFLAIAAGLVVSVVWGQLHPVIENIGSLSEISGRPVLGSVSLIRSAKMIRRERRGLIGLAGALGMLLLVQFTWLLSIAEQLNS